jgi:hypothetical protein
MSFYAQDNLAVDVELERLLKKLDPMALVWNPGITVAVAGVSVFNATVADAARVSRPYLTGPMWIEDLIFRYATNVTTNNLNYWTIGLDAYNAGLASNMCTVNLQTVTTLPLVVPIQKVLQVADAWGFTLTITKVGAPGNLGLFAPLIRVRPINL